MMRHKGAHTGAAFNQDPSSSTMLYKDGKSTLGLTQPENEGGEGGGDCMLRCASG